MFYPLILTHVLVLKRNVSLRQFFRVSTTYVLIVEEDNNYFAIFSRGLGLTIKLPHDKTNKNPVWPAETSA